MSDQATNEFATAQVLLDQRRWRDAETHLRRAIQLQRSNADLHAHLAISLARQERFDEALQLANHAQSLDPRCAAAFEARALALGDQGNWAAALAEVERGLKAEPSGLRLIMSAAIYCNLLEDASGAAQYAARVRELAPMSFEAALAEAESHYAAGNHESALAAYQHAISVNPHYIRALGQQGLLKQNHLEDLRGAIQDYSRAVEIDPEYKVAFGNRGVAKTDLKDYQGALADLNRALQIDPNYAWALFRRGRLKQNHLQDLRGAIQDYSRVVELDPEDKVSFGNRALAKKDLKDYQGALADLERALHIDPNYVWALFQRGLLKHEHLDDLNGAIQDYSRVVQIDPQHKDSHADLALAKHALGDVQSALRDYDRALAIDPEFAFALRNRAACCDELNDHEGALSSRARLYQVEPKTAYTLQDEDARFWHGTSFRHFNRTLLPELKRTDERLVEFWECYLVWGAQTSQTWYEGTSGYVHDARSGAGYICMTDRSLRIVTLGDITRRFVKRRGIMGRIFLAALRNIDMSRRELNDRSWTITHGDLHGVSTSEDAITLNTVSEIWQFFPYFSVDAPQILAALNLARAGRIPELFRSPEPEPAAPLPAPSAQPDIFAAIQQLGQLRDQGLITEEEYQNKKTELLARL